MNFKCILLLLYLGFLGLLTLNAENFLNLVIRFNLLAK